MMLRVMFISSFRLEVSISCSKMHRLEEKIFEEEAKEEEDVPPPSLPPTKTSNSMEKYLGIRHGEEWKSNTECGTDDFFVTSRSTSRGFDIIIDSIGTRENKSLYCFNVLTDLGHGVAN